MTVKVLGRGDDDAWRYGRDAVLDALDAALWELGNGGALPLEINGTRFRLESVVRIVNEAVEKLLDRYLESETGELSVANKQDVSALLDIQKRHVDLVFAMPWVAIAQAMTDVLLQEEILEAPSAARISLWSAESPINGPYGVERRDDGLSTLTMARLHLEHVPTATEPVAWSIPFDETEFIAGTLWDRRRAQRQPLHPGAPFPNTRIGHVAHLLRALDRHVRARRGAGAIPETLPVIAGPCRYADDASGLPTLANRAFGLGDDSKLVDVLTKYRRPAVLACFVGEDGDLDPGTLMIDTRRGRRLSGDMALDGLLAGAGAVAPQMIDIALDDRHELRASLGIPSRVSVQVVREELYMHGKRRNLAIWRDPDSDSVAFSVHNLPVDTVDGKTALLRQLNALWGAPRSELGDCRRRFPNAFRVPYEVRATTYDARRNQLGLGMAVNLGVVPAIVEKRRPAGT